MPQGASKGLQKLYKRPPRSSRDLQGPPRMLRLHIHFYCNFPYFLCLKGLQGTSKASKDLQRHIEGLEGLQKPFKRPPRSSRDLQGPSRTSKDLQQPPGTSKDIQGDFGDI